MKSFFKIAAIWAVVILGGCGGGTPGQFSYTDTGMGTVIQQTLYSSDMETAQNFSQKAMELLANLEQEQLSWRLETSEVYGINASSGSWCPLSEKLSGILADCLEISEVSEGAFDVTLGTLVRLWDIDSQAVGGQEDFELPSVEAIGQALGQCGYGRLVLDGQERIVLPEGMQLDLGAVGKGIALTELAVLLKEESRISGAVIAVGGSVLTWGKKPDGTSWKVGIADPFGLSVNVGVLSLEGQWCVSTSGDYERYVEVDGVRYHHILDPATGYPARSGVRGVTILSKDGLLSDALSTACFILGPRKGMELAKSYGAEVLFILEDGEIVMSEGMAGYWSE